MKKIFKIIFPAVLVVFFFGNGNAQSYDAKLSLIVYDSFPGYPNSTPYYDYYGGRYRIDVNGNNRTLRITHSIPNNLNDGNGHNVPFSIASNNAGYKLGGNLSPNGAVIFNPNSPLVVFMQATDKITIWLGGTVSPPTNAFPSDDYQGTITITTVIL